MGKEKVTKITKICIVVGGKEIELSLEEAKELMGILDETFGEKEVTKLVPSPYPIYIERPYRWTYTYWSAPTYENGTYTVANTGFTRTDGLQETGLRTYT